MLSNAQLIQQYAQEILDDQYMNEDDKMLKIIQIRNLAETYVSAEQREDDEAAALVQRIQNGKLIPHYETELQPHAAFETEPGLSGHEMAAFETQKFTDTLGEDPKH